MSLASGTRLGPYEILSPLGAGGMGEVYRAKDPRLGREVAVKVLPASFSTDADRLRRFEQEARAVSALNHPNIVVVHDVGRSDSVAYLAMELVQGRSLRELLLRGPLTVRRTLLLGTQIAEGLARAHASGIVHRDLKPENVMVTEEGTVKLLDFGLAKLASPQAEGLTSAPTSAPDAEGTQEGVVLGTVAYMSPEQAAGRTLDHRSDQFALGSILYEMLAGRRPFARPTAAETLAAIIREDSTPVASAAPDTPAPLAWIVERCLAKEPSDRYDSTRDLARDLATVEDRVSGASTPSGIDAAAQGRPAIRWLPWLVAAVLLAALVASLLRPRAAAPARGDVIRFSVLAPEKAGFASSEIFTNSALSPDGRLLALIGRSQGISRLYVRRLDSLTAPPLPGSEGAVSPFWAPDGRQIAFFAAGKLLRIRLEGGPPQPICETSWEGAGSWSPHGQILFAEAVPGREGIYAVSAKGGSARRVTIPDAGRGEKFHFWPYFLPDGRHFVFVTVRPGGESATAHEARVGSLDSKETRSLGRIDSRIEYAPPGFLLYVDQGTLLARPFDALALRWAGDARLVVPGDLHYFFGPANAGFSVSQNGVLAYERGRTRSRVVWMDRNGSEISTVASLGEVDHVRLSPDGRKAALSVLDPRFGTSDIWVYDLSRNVSTRLTSSPNDEQSPVWAPDGTRLAYRSDGNGPPDLFQISSAGAGSARSLLARGGVQTAQDFSPDGRSLLFEEADRKTGFDLWLLPLGDEGKPLPLLRTRFDEGGSRFSPDGRWIAYHSNESGQLEIYVTSLAGGGRTRVSTNGGHSPHWRADGRELFFEAPGRRIMAAPVETSAGFEAGVPAELFSVASELFAWDVAPDGRRFLVSVAASTPDPPITIVVRWPEASGVL